jgi:LCP family protein required for cell wall assembly
LLPAADDPLPPAADRPRVRTRQRVPDRPRVPSARRAPSGRPRRSFGRKILVVLLVLLVAVVGFGIWVDTQLNRVAALPATSAGTGDGTNWLIVGSDSRAGLTAEEEKELATGGDVGQRTDTIMLLHSGANGAVLVSLPRDSYVEIPGRRGRDKLNASYAYGGAPLLIGTVEKATGLRIDHYAEIGFNGFVGAVDAVGGVDLCVPQAIKDPKAALNIKAGCQELDGATALGYVRTRATAGSDFDRVERQRAFLSALVKKATSPATLANPFRVVPLTSAVSAAITVDDDDHVWNLLGLGLAMRSISSGEGVTTTVPVGSTPTIGGASVVRWNDSRSDALFTALKNDEKPTGSALGP